MQKLKEWPIFPKAWAKESDRKHKIGDLKKLCENYNAYGCNTFEDEGKFFPNEDEFLCSFANILSSLISKDSKGEVAITISRGKISLNFDYGLMKVHLEGKVAFTETNEIEFTIARSWYGALRRKPRKIIRAIQKHDLLGIRTSENKVDTLIISTNI